MFSHSEQKDFSSCRKTFCGVFNTAFYLSKAAFWGEVKSFLIFLQNKRKVFGRLVIISFKGLAKLNSMCPKDELQENIFWAKFILFISFLDTAPKMFVLLSKCLRRACQNCILRVHSSILTIFFVNHDGHSENFRPSGQHFSGGFSKLHSNCPLDSSQKKVFFGNH